MANTADREGDGRVATLPAEGQSSRKTLTVALAGAPNVGKSTIFNLLTGLSQHVGNWPGKTVEVKTGVHHRGDVELEIVDLPGTYSLTANSPEEQVARDYIIERRPDVVVVALNAANLERTLYLVAEALELPSPVVVAINMVDVAGAEGTRVEPGVLQAVLGVPVVPMVASRGEGVRELVEAAVRLARGTSSYTPKRPEPGPGLGALVGRVEELLGAEAPPSYPRRWLALKLLEGDRDIVELVRASLPGDRWEQLNTLLRENEDAVVSIAGARYAWIERMVRAAVVAPRHGVISITDRLDRAATHSLLGPAILLGFLGILFWLVYRIGGPVKDLLDGAMGGGSDLLRQSLVGAPPWVAGLLVDGMLAGVGTVLTLLPILVIFFLGMALLEDVGYMARAAFVADRFMHLMGLHGKSFLPLFLGFGCNVPAVLGTRVIDSHRARLLTILLAPLVPCSARMVVLVLVAGAIFGDAAPLVTWGLVAVSLTLLALSGALLDRTLFRGERPAFIMELPLYHLPNWRTIALDVWQHTRSFVVRAGTIILVVSVLVWVLADLPSGNIEESYLAQVGRLLEPLGGLMGLDWRMMVAVLTSFLAKENVLATMAVLAAGGQEGSLAVALPGMLTPAAALAFLVLQVTFIPCVATVGAIQQETRSWRWTAFAVLYLLALSLAMGIATYQGARLLGWGV